MASGYHNGACGSGVFANSCLSHCWLLEEHLFPLLKEYLSLSFWFLSSFGSDLSFLGRAVRDGVVDSDGNRQFTLNRMLGALWGCVLTPAWKVLGFPWVEADSVPVWPRADFGCWVNRTGISGPSLELRNNARLLRCRGGSIWGPLVPELPRWDSVCKGSESGCPSLGSAPVRQRGSAEQLAPKPIASLVLNPFPVPPRPR